jgi:PAS domain S-box-containing protein
VRGGHLSRPIVLIVLLLAYVASARLGLHLAFVHESTSAVWPPTGLAMAALLVLGFNVWPVIAIGAFVVNLLTSGVFGPSVLIAVGNTLEAVTGAWLAQRFAAGAAAFERTSTIVRFTGLAALGATTIAASIGTLALVSGGLAAPEDIPSIWFTWWLGDAVGAMVITPLIVLWRRPLATSGTARRRAEAAALVATLVLVSVLVFGVSPEREANYPLEFIVMPVLLWCAFRLGARETAAAATVVGVIAIAGTLRGGGPFARSSPNESLLLLQAFVGITTVMMLSVAAEVERRRTAEAQLQSLNAELERRVVEGTDQLRRVNARLIEAQRVAHVGSWEWDVGTNTLWWSEELYRIYGVDPAQVATYEGFLAHVHAEDRARVDGIVRQAMRDRQSFAFEHRIARPDGAVRVLYAAGHVEHDSRQRPIRLMGIGHDITDLKEAEEQRAKLMQAEAAQREAEETSRAKDQFLAILSHELRTPLNAALGWAHMLRQSRPDDRKGARAVDAIYRNLVIQARLVSDLLDVTRIARGGLVLEQAPLDLRDVIDSALDMVGEAATAKNITIDAQMPAVAADVSGDAKRLQQVVWNLLSNGVRFGRVNGHVSVDVAPAPDGIVIQVEDDGPGIDPEFLPHIFEPFRQADQSPTRQHDGLGLGLAIAKHIVEAHGGSIHASNGAGGGAVFIVRLPARPATASV